MIGDTHIWPHVRAHVGTRVVLCPPPHQFPRWLFVKKPSDRFDLNPISSATPVFSLHLQRERAYTRTWCDSPSLPRLCVSAYEPLAYTSTLVYFLFFDRPAGRPTSRSYVSLWDRIFTKVPHGRESKVHLAVRCCPRGSRLPHFPTLRALYVARMHLLQLRARARSNLTGEIAK